MFRQRGAVALQFSSSHWVWILNLNSEPHFNHLHGQMGHLRQTGLIPCCWRWKSLIESQRWCVVVLWVCCFLKIDTTKGFPSVSSCYFWIWYWPIWFITWRLYLDIPYVFIGSDWSTRGWHIFSLWGSKLFLFSSLNYQSLNTIYLGLNFPDINSSVHGLTWKTNESRLLLWCLTSITSLEVLDIIIPWEV